MRIITVHKLIKNGRVLLLDRVPPRSRAAAVLTGPAARSPRERVGLTVTTSAVAGMLGIVRYLPLGGTVSIGPFTVELAWVGSQAFNPLIDGRWYYLATLPDMPYRGPGGATLLFPALERPTTDSLNDFKRFVRESAFMAVIASGPHAVEWRRLCAPRIAVEVREGPAQTSIEW